jgi:hypothetical protein
MHGKLVFATVAKISAGGRLKEYWLNEARSGASGLAVASPAPHAQ